METAMYKMTGQPGGLSGAIWISRPTKCPRCKHAIGANVIHSHRYCDGKDHPHFVVLFQCDNCFKPFMCIFKEDAFQTGGGNKSYKYTLMDIGPIEIEKRDFSADIFELSCRFSDIYNQAYAAEQSGLTEVCGMAYGKALEFLVKDYAISRHPDNAQEISAMLLGKCIQKYVDGAKIQILAERCAWLRNDEAHYIRKHEELDLADLKKLLEGVIRAIEIDLLTDAAAEIQPMNRA